MFKWLRIFQDTGPVRVSERLKSNRNTKPMHIQHSFLGLITAPLHQGFEKTMMKCVSRNKLWEVNISTFSLHFYLEP